MSHTQTSTYKRISSLVLLAVLSAGVLLTPVHGLAQAATQPETESASHKSSPGLGNSLRPGQVKREESEEEDVYRHTALVAAISDAVFHDKAQTTPAEVRARHIEITARTFEWVNTIIILLAIVLPIARILPKVFRKREQKLRHSLETARKTTAEANARLSAVEARLARLDDEIGKIRAQVEEESKQDEARIKASIEEESARIVASAEQEISAAAAHAQRGLKAFAADLAIEQAAKQLILTPETDRELIGEFIASASSDGETTFGRTGGRR